MPHVPDPKSSIHEDLTLASEVVNHLLSYFQHGGLPAGSHIQCLDNGGGGEARYRGLTNVLNVNKNAACATVLKYVDRLAKTSLIAEYRQDTGVGIIERLARSIDVLETQPKGPQTQSTAKHQGHLLLGQFRKSIERRGMQPGIFGCRHRLHFTATARTDGLELL